MRSMYRREWFEAALLMLACFLAGCGSGSGNGTSIGSGSPSGVQGQARRGPLSPAATPKTSNDGPLGGVIITLLRQDGTEAARQTTDTAGNFRIGVPAGTYQVVGLAPGGSSGFPAPPAAQTVTVPANQYVTVTVEYDTGIR